MEKVSRRLKRVASLLQHLVGEILEQEINDPRLAMTTITSVKVSSDLRHAAVYVSIFGDDSEREKTMQALEQVRPKVAALLGERVEMRYTPRIYFRRDKGAERSFRVMEIIDRLNRGEKSG